MRSKSAAQAARILGAAAVLSLGSLFIGPPRGPLAAAAAEVDQPPAPGMNRETCAGYPEPRAPIEAQNWWSDRGEDHEFGSHHVHLFACWPVNGTEVRGRFYLDVRILLHAHEPGSVFYMLDGGLETSGTGITSASAGCAFSLKPNFRTYAQDHVFWYHVECDTARWSADGAPEMRMRARVRDPQGDRQFNSTGWPLSGENGKTPESSERSHRALNILVGRGWYDHGIEYSNAEFQSSGQLLTPRSGIWRPTIRTLAPSGEPITRSYAYLDPDFHHGSHGTLILDDPGDYRGAVTIDTTALSNGPHRLVIRADSDITGGFPTPGVNSGIMSVTFQVQNGATLSP